MGLLLRRVDERFRRWHSGDFRLVAPLLGEPHALLVRLVSVTLPSAGGPCLITEEPRPLQNYENEWRTTFHLYKMTFEMTSCITDRHIVGIYSSGYVHRSDCFFRGILGCRDPESGGSRLIWNVDNYVPISKASYSRELDPSTTLLWEYSDLTQSNNLLTKA